MDPEPMKNKVKVTDADIFANEDKNKNTYYGVS